MKKLVLFDIDGTLLYHVGQHATDFDRVNLSANKVWGISVDMHGSLHSGWTSRGTVWDLLKTHNISRKEFIDKYPQFQDAMHAFLEEKSKLGKIYEAIVPAQELLHRLLADPRYYVGLLTGNVTSVGRWKLRDAGCPDIPFGIFGEEADSRIELAKLVFEKAENYFHTSIAPRDIIVIGDTILDVQCGKAIGAQTIAVTTGKHHTREMLAGEKPDLLVDSLMDPAVLAFFN